MTTELDLKQNGDPVICELLESLVSEEMIFVYRIVGKLRYPITDPAALDAQIKEELNSEEAKAVKGFLVNALLEQDFPLPGARGTLELLLSRVQRFIPWASPLLVPIGIGLGGGTADDFSGSHVCQQAVRPLYENCYNTANGASPYIQRLERLACHGRALGAVLQCNERVGELERRAIWARFYPLGRRALRNYAACVVDRLWNQEDPDACLGTYKAVINRYRHPYRYGGT